ncbi:hypothetical protein QAD02_021212 [Eretmocerus hayati]|uniref:Uncharacterized protein n=1 Tax=Eretmocerus hayati TaxID=131215 RepID=A0ACC2PP98_9HYME|nr:hypothetical protein QAD02_021212 [Eretmocerus hayati]
MLEKDVFEVSTPELPPVTNFTRPTVIVSTSSIGIVPKVDTVRPKPKITNVVTLTEGILPLVEKTKPQISIASASLDNCADAGSSTISKKIALNISEISSTEPQTPEPTGVVTRLQDAQLRAPSRVYPTIREFFHRNELRVAGPRTDCVAASPRYAEFRVVLPITALDRREADLLIYYLTRRIGYLRVTYSFIVLNIRDFEEPYAAVLAVRKEIHQRNDRLNSMMRDVRYRCLFCNAHTGYSTRVTAVMCSKCK